LNTARTDGHLIVNADDWGRDRQTTDCTLDCVKKGAVSAVSAMVFMEDSERAAAIAREHSIDAGLHLNFTSPFTSTRCPARLDQQQRRITAYLRAHRMAQLVFNPMLTGAFDDVVRAQVDEFRRLYGVEPARIDGHHHMHLCANVVLQGLLPTGTVVRRNFTFRPGEKGIVNRMYRQLLDRALARRHPMVDHLFSIEPLNPPERLQRIFSLAQQEVVELETHPVNPGEYAFLTSSEFPRSIGTVPSTFAVVASRVAPGQERVHERA